MEKSALNFCFISDFIYFCKKLRVNDEFNP